MALRSPDAVAKGESFRKRLAEYQREFDEESRALEAIEKNVAAGKDPDGSLARESQRRRAASSERFSRQQAELRAQEAGSIRGIREAHAERIARAAVDSHVAIVAAKSSVLYIAPALDCASFMRGETRVLPSTAYAASVNLQAAWTQLWPSGTEPIATVRAMTIQLLQSALGPRRKDSGNQPAGMWQLLADDFKKHIAAYAVEHKLDLVIDYRAGGAPGKASNEEFIVRLGTAPPDITAQVVDYYQSIWKALEGLDDDTDRAKTPVRR